MTGSICEVYCIPVYCILVSTCLWMLVIMCCCFTLGAIWQGPLAAHLHLCLSSLPPSSLPQSRIELASQTPAHGETLTLQTMQQGLQ